MLSLKSGEVPRAQLGASGPVRDTLRLRDADVWRNLLVMVGIPYLKRKLDESYDIHAAPHAALASAGGDTGAGGARYNPADDLPHNPTAKQRIMFYYKWFLRNVYPSVNAGYYFAVLAFNLAYLFDNTKYSSPFLWMIGTRIRRLGSADYKAIAMVTEPPKVSGGGGRGRSWLSPQAVYPPFLRSLKMLLPASIFALKFLEWWHASDFSRQLARKATETLDLPAPVVSGMPKPAPTKPITPSPSEDPTAQTQTQTQTQTQKRPSPPISSTSLLPIFTVPLPSPSPSSTANDDDESPCPICLNPLVNPTACPTGYVFCYTCIFRWVQGEHERQEQFMAGGREWEDEDQDQNEDGNEDADTEKGGEDGKSREGKWESGLGRCAVTGRRVLGGTEGLRRVLV